MRMKKQKSILSTIAISILLTGCGGGGGDSIESTPIPNIKFDTKEKLGESLFFDQNISLTRNTSCATCHDPEHAFIDTRFSKEGADQDIFINGALSVGDDNVALGGRNTPTATYANLIPEFSLSTNGTPKGGQFHDGRATTLKDQAMRPPLDPDEMMMENEADVVTRIADNPEYVESFKALFGEAIFDDINASYNAMGEAIGEFEKTDEFSPFTSRYDKSLRGEINLTTEEKRGSSLFFSPTNNNCVSCHKLNLPGAINEPFSDFTYHNIGTPKNLAALVAKGLPSTHVDHGVFRDDSDVNASFDGAVRVPTLRNVAVTAPYMHNGVFQELKTVLEFYVHLQGGGEKPLNPETNSPWRSPDVNNTVNHTLLQKGQSMTDEDIINMIAFLRALTDERYEHLMPPFQP